MKNKFFLIFCLLFFKNSLLLAESFKIQAKNITIDKNSSVSIFRDDVIIATEDDEIVQSNYAEYDKKKEQITLKNNIIIIDNQKNKTKSNYVVYDVLKKSFFSKGLTEIQIKENYIVQGENILLDAKKSLIQSDSKTIITDQDNNKIYLESFQYLKNKNIFKSIGLIQIEDISGNNYEFSQIYIDTKKKEILGTDTKAFLNNKKFKISEKNDPRVFSNTVKLNKNLRVFDKSIFTLCGYREDDKCPPWSIQASKMLHDNKKKTIYYDNAVVKVYNIPIFYFPKLSHPDPSVERRSGFLAPAFSDGKNLGAGITLPYFFNLNKDKNLTFVNKLFVNQHPLIIGEYHQAFKNTNFLLDLGYTKGLKKSDKLKKGGSSDHLFSKIVTNFKSSNDAENILNITTQHVSNDKYLELYKLKSDLVNYNANTLENSLNYTHEYNNLFFGFNASIYETLDESYNDKYEYVLPEITLEKNLLSDKNFGNLNLISNYKVNNYDTNKLTNFLVNDFDWNFKETNFDSGFKSKILGNFKNINYEAKNVKEYKSDTTSELYGALGYLTEINLFKKNGDVSHFLKPKFLLRYSPGSMRKETSGSRLNPINSYNLNRSDNIYNFENGLSSTVGFNYKMSENEKEIDFSVAQIINEKENKKMASKSSLDEKLSDLVGSVNYKINNKISYNYEFSLDQNYNDINYNELGAVINFGPVNFDLNYLEERKHIGEQNYVKSKLNYNYSDKGELSFETKRNLVTDSTEFYNLSYEYVNDCLRAGLVYRREFYEDSELEPENSLMFKITLTPFGNINSPSLDQ